MHHRIIQRIFLAELLIYWLQTILIVANLGVLSDAGSCYMLVLGYFFLSNICSEELCSVLKVCSADLGVLSDVGSP